MKPFKSHHGIIAKLDRSNVDTDQIIAKQFLKSIARTGFGPQLFYDWRYKADGTLNAGFSLNAPCFKNASILVTGNNFGCGSSREHAVWAIKQYGFEVVVAPRMKKADGSEIPGFADIFKNNCSKNSLLTIELGEAEVKQIFQVIDENTGLEATADLEKQLLVLHISAIDGTSSGASPKNRDRHQDLRQEISFHFDIDASVKERLLHGLDDIGTTLKYEDALRAFEAKHDPQISVNG